MKTIALLVSMLMSAISFAQDIDPFAAAENGFLSLSGSTNTTPYVLDVWTNDGSFARLIAKADRVVIRSGGFDCCAPVDDQKHLVVLTNLQAIADFNSTIALVATQEVGFSCMCCGFPGVDWYRGTNRLALTAIQHGQALRWKGFPSDVSFTPDSSRSLAAWLLDHGIPDPHRELQKIVDKKELPTTKPTLSFEAAPISAPSER